MNKIQIFCAILLIVLSFINVAVDEERGGHIGQATGSSPISLNFAGKTFGAAPASKVQKTGDSISSKDIKFLKGHQDDVTSLAFSPNGKKIASGSFDKTIKIWDSISFKEIKTLKGHNNWVSSVAFSPDGKKIVSADLGRNPNIKIWDASSGKEIKTLHGHETSVKFVTFSPDGKKIVSSSHASGIIIWDVISGREIQKFYGHKGGNNGIAFSPDGKKIASCGLDGMIKIWDIISGKEIRNMVHNSTNAYYLSFSPDGKTIACSGFDRITLWDTASGQQVFSFKDQSPICALFSPDGKSFIFKNIISQQSSESSGAFHDTVVNVKILELSSKKVVECYKESFKYRSTYYFSSFALSPDGERFACGGGQDIIISTLNIDRKSLNSNP